jgi:hypothetical protein
MHLSLKKTAWATHLCPEQCHRIAVCDFVAFWISAQFMGLLRYFHTSPWQVFRSRDHGVNPLQLRHTAFRFPGRGWVAPGWCLTCKKNLVLVEGKTLASILYPVMAQCRRLACLMPRRVDGPGHGTYGTRRITDELPVIWEPSGLR